MAGGDFAARQISEKIFTKIETQIGARQTKIVAPGMSPVMERQMREQDDSLIDLGAATVQTLGVPKGQNEEFGSETEQE